MEQGERDREAYQGCTSSAAAPRWACRNVRHKFADVGGAASSAGAVGGRVEAVAGGGHFVNNGRYGLFGAAARPSLQQEETVRD